MGPAAKLADKSLKEDTIQQEEQAQVDEGHMASLAKRFPGLIYLFALAADMFIVLGVMGATFLIATYFLAR